MLSRIHNKLGTAGLVVAIVALVAALGGAAFAAGGLTKQQEKQVIKIAKKYAGKRGPTGPAGPAGTAGAKGDKGDPGAKGATGPKGATGEKGAKGEKGEKGEKGATGVTGFTEKLPTGKTETGTWAFGPTTGTQFSSITGSFNIPLAKAPKKAIRLKEGEGETAECPGTAAEPKAAAGFLCVYTSNEEHKFGFFSEFFLLKTGWMSIVGATEAEGLALGTWAVTAE